LKCSDSCECWIRGERKFRIAKHRTELLLQKVIFRGSVVISWLLSINMLIVDLIFTRDLAKL